MFKFLGVTFHWYGLLIGLALWAGLSVSTKNYPEKKDEIDGVFGWALGLGLLGARLYHVIDFWNRYYVFYPVEVFKVWKGGLGIWGGIAGAIAGVFVYSLMKKKKMISYTDILVTGAPLAQAIGRLGNYVNNEIVGKNGEPLFAYEGALNLLLLVILLGVNKKTEGQRTGIYLVGYGLIRMALEGMRPDDLIWKTAGVPVSHLMSIAAITTGVWIMTKIRFLKRI